MEEARPHVSIRRDMRRREEEGAQGHVCRLPPRKRGAPVRRRRAEMASFTQAHWPESYDEVFPGLTPLDRAGRLEDMVCLDITWETRRGGPGS
jgi:hypothetical protein